MHFLPGTLRVKGFIDPINKISAKLESLREMERKNDRTEKSPGHILKKLIFNKKFDITKPYAIYIINNQFKIVISVHCIKHRNAIFHIESALFCT